MNTPEHIQIRRRDAVLALVCFWVLLVTVPAGQWVYEWCHPEARPWRDLAPVIAGEANVYEERLEDHSWWRHYLLSPMQTLLVHYGRTGNETVAVGKGGWLYADAGIRFFARTALPEAAAAILDFAWQLRERGIALAVVAVPPKPALAPEPLGGTSVFQPGWPELAGKLEATGIRVVDLTGALQELRESGVEPFLTTDTHWRPEAVPAAAQAIAAALRLPQRKVDTAVEWVTQTGDLVPLLRLQLAAAWYPPETVPVAVVSDVPRGRARILLVGDSFSNIYSYDGMGWGRGSGLPERLAATIGEPVDWIARNGNGAYASREALMRHPELLEDKELVIWEVAMRELAEGDWKLLPLPEKTTAAPASRQRITGVIAAASEAPRSGLAVYPHLLRCFRIGDALVYVEAMRDRKLSDAAYWRVGDTVTLEVIPWEDVEAEYDAWSRGEFSDPALWRLPQWLGRPVSAAATSAPLQ